MENRILAPSDDLEKKALQTYELLKEICASPDAAPCVKANAQKALAAAWQIVNDLGLVHEQLFDLGV